MTNHEINGNYDNEYFTKEEQLDLTEGWWDHFPMSWEAIKSKYKRNDWLPTEEYSNEK